MEVSGQLHSPAALPTGKEPWYPLDRRLGGPQSRSEHGGEKKNSQPLPGFEHPIIQPVAQSYDTELSRVLAIVIIIKLITIYEYVNFTFCTLWTRRPLISI
jgi:hypothetical protein